MNELTEAIAMLNRHVVTCMAPTQEESVRALELAMLLRAMPAIISRVRERQMACLRALTRHEWAEARELAASAELELERMESGFLTERLQVPGAPPATLRTMEFDGVLCWTLRSELTGELLYSGHIAEQPPEATRTAQAVAKDSCYWKLRTIAQGEVRA